MSTKETQLVTQREVQLVISELVDLVKDADASQFLVSQFTHLSCLSMVYTLPMFFTVDEC